MYEFLKEKMTLKDCTIFLEAVSKEMKKKGQREMWKQYSSVLYKLNSYFTKKWSNPKKTKKRLFAEERRTKKICRDKRIF